MLTLWHGWVFALVLVSAAAALGYGLHSLLFRLLHRNSAEHSLRLGLYQHLAWPARAVFALACVFAIEPFVPVPRSWHDHLREFFSIATIFSLGWVAVGGVYVLQQILLQRYDLKEHNDLHARRVRTQFQVFRRVIVGFVIVVTLGVALYTFQDARLWHAGTGLLASAGLASLLLAAAAKSTASNFLAGMQIALTEPIRLEDVVVVQGEWGRVEEITSSYVVVRIWDLRRLIVPLTYFIENSFQNWTRETSNLLGTAFLYLDFTVPVEPLRQHLREVVAAAPQWDGSVCSLQVTDVKERTLELRCVVSAANASDTFDLRCLVREQMIAFVRENHPEALPRMRLTEGAVGSPSVFGAKEQNGSVPGS